MGPSRGPPGCRRPQMGLMMAPWTLLSGTVTTLLRHWRYSSLAQSHWNFLIELVYTSPDLTVYDLFLLLTLQVPALPLYCTRIDTCFAMPSRQQTQYWLHILLASFIFAWDVSDLESPLSDKMESLKFPTRKYLVIQWVSMPENTLTSQVHGFSRIQNLARGYAIYNIVLCWLLQENSVQFKLYIIIFYVMDIFVTTKIMVQGI